jgi:Ca2+/H+ antiporter
MNPMLRAAHLAHGDASRKVLLVVPWVELEQQALIYPPNLTFETREQQAEYILKGVCSIVTVTVTVAVATILFVPGTESWHGE